MSFGLGTALEKFPQYSNGIADSSYAFDFCVRIMIAGTSSSAPITFPVQTNVIRIRSIVLEDVTAAVGGTAPALIACYYRIDGRAAGAGSAPDGSTSRILKPAENRALSRFIPSEFGVMLYNPNATAVTIQVELAA
jgi:hypothetical protein